MPLNDDAIIESANFNAVRPTARAVADLYLRQFHPGARADRDPFAIDAAQDAIQGATHRFDFKTASGKPGTIFLGEAAGGGWQVKARQTHAESSRTAHGAVA